MAMYKITITKISSKCLKINTLHDGKKPEEKKKIQ